MSASVDAPGIVLLDGAMATELAARGFVLAPPLYSAAALIDAPELVEQLHLDYIRAGAQVITTNSFGLHVHTLARAGVAEQAGALIGRAVELVERARRRAAHDDGARTQGWAKVRCAGSLPPLRMAGPRELALAEQATLARALQQAGVDLLLLETHTSVAEVELSLEAIAGVELPIWLSVVAGMPSGGPQPDGSRLLGGDGFEQLFAAIAGHRVDALLVNCTQIDAVPAAMRSLMAARSGASPRLRELPLGLYPHLGRASWDGTWHDRFLEPDVLARQLAAWQASWPALAILGACCGSNPDDIAALRRVLHPEPDARARAFVRLAELVP